VVQGEDASADGLHLSAGQGAAAFSSHAVVQP
jgi:hypothetical protein